MQALGGALEAAAMLILVFLPFAMIAGWRTWVHARKYREHKAKGWRGVFEAAGLGLALALLLLMGGIVTRPTHALPYIVFYGGGAGLIGGVIRIVLRFTGIVALRVAMKRSSMAS